MNKTLIAVIGFFGFIAIFALVLVVMAVSFYNKGVGFQNLITAKQTDNKNQMDGMWKTIAQSGEVAQKDRDSLGAIFKDYAAARSTDNKAVFNWIKEAVPNVQVNSDSFKNLMNIIVAQRDGFKQRQTELIDINREYDNLISQFPGVVFAKIFGFKHIDIVIVTSSRTEDAFKTGKDDDVHVFDNNNQPVEKK